MVSVVLHEGQRSVVQSENVQNTASIESGKNLTTTDVVSMEIEYS